MCTYAVVRRSEWFVSERLVTSYYSGARQTWNGEPVCVGETRNRLQLPLLSLPFSLPCTRSLPQTATQLKALVTPYGDTDPTRRSEQADLAPQLLFVVLAPLV